MRAPPDPARDFAEVWDTFRSAPTTLGPTPGVREAWARGRARYAVWVLPVTDETVRARLAAAADRLAPHGLRPFPDPHITVFVAGFPAAAPTLDDDIAEAVLDAQLAAVRAARPRRPRLQVAGLNAFQSCAILEVWDPHNDLDTLRAPLAGCHPEIRFATYRPHVTVGSFGDTRDTAPITNTILPLRTLQTVPVVCDTLDLVTFDARIERGSLTTHVRVPLE